MAKVGMWRFVGEPSQKVEAVTEAKESEEQNDVSSVSSRPLGGGQGLWVGVRSFIRGKHAIPGPQRTSCIQLWVKVWVRMRCTKGQSAVGQCERASADGHSGLSAENKPRKPTQSKQNAKKERGGKEPGVLKISW